MALKSKKSKATKYKVDDKVYSYQNPTVKRPINMIRKSDDRNFQHKYRLTLKDKDGYNTNSNWISESSLSKRKK